MTIRPPECIVAGMGKTAAYHVARVRPDSKGRITLGRLAEGVSSYKVKIEANGKIVLEPFAEIPARERWLFENPEALRRVKKGLTEAEAGQTLSLGSFSGKRK